MTRNINDVSKQNHMFVVNVALIGAYYQNRWQIKLEILQKPFRKLQCTCYYGRQPNFSNDFIPCNKISGQWKWFAV